MLEVKTASQHLATGLMIIILYYELKVCGNIRQIFKQNLCYSVTIIYLQTSITSSILINLTIKTFQHTWNNQIYGLHLYKHMMNVEEFIFHS